MECILGGNLDAARRRLVKLAEIAATELDDAGSLNAVSVGLACRLISKLGPRGIEIYEQMLAEFNREGFVVHEALPLEVVERRKGK